VEDIVKDADMHVDGNFSRWTAPSHRAMAWTEVLDMSRALATQMHINIEVTQGDNREVVDGR
jgi:hypothetical protein